VKYYSIANLRSVPRCQHRYGNPRWLLKSRHTGLFILTPVLPNPRHAPHRSSSPINFSVSHHHTRITEEAESTSTSVNKDYCISFSSEPSPSLPSYFLPNIDLGPIHFTAPLPPSFPRGSQAVTPAARTWLIRLISSRLDLDLGPAISFSFIFASHSPNKIPLSLSTSSVILRFCSDLTTQ
jgi:hypothetical protein